MHLLSLKLHLFPIYLPPRIEILMAHHHEFSLYATELKTEVESETQQEQFFKFELWQTIVY